MVEEKKLHFGQFLENPHDIMSFLLKLLKKEKEDFLDIIEKSPRVNFVSKILLVAKEEKNSYCF